MQANAFKRAAALVANPKDVKANLRLLPRKTPTALLVTSAIGLAVSVSDLELGLGKYVVGFQLNDELKAQARTNLGPVYQHLFALAKVVKAKVPASGKKVKLHGETTTEGLLKLHALSTALLAVVQGLTSGQGLTEKHELEEQVVDYLKAKVEELIGELYAFTYTLLGIVPADVLVEQFELLKATYGAELFEPKAKEVAEPEAAAE